MNWFDLDIVMTVTREKSMRKAAKKLHLSQASVSKRIQHIEDEYNFRLFDRRADGVELTENGKVFVKYASRSLQVFHEGIDQLQNRSKEKRVLQFGVTSPLVPHVRRFAASFATQYPGDKLELVTLDSISIVEKLREGILDFGMFSHHLPPQGLQFDALFLQHFYLIGDEKFLNALNRLAGMTFPYVKPELLRVLGELPLIVPRKGFGLRIMIDEMYRKELNREPKIVAESDTSAVIKELVGSGLGCMIQSEIAVNATALPGEAGHEEALFGLNGDAATGLLRVPLSFMFPPRHVYFARSGSRAGSFSGEQLRGMFAE